jgi:hypothetical protein
MNRRLARALGSAALIGGVMVSWSARVAPLAAAGLMLPACDGFDCNPRSCSDLGSGSNGKTFKSCAACGGDSGCSIELRDETGKAFYDCSDTDGKNCSTDPGFLSAEESYCGF